MSAYAQYWAFEQHLPPKEKLTLLVLAENGSPSGKNDYCKFPSISYLKKKTSMRESSVYKSIKFLLNHGYISFNADPSIILIGKPIEFKLNMR